MILGWRWKEEEKKQNKNKNLLIETPSLNSKHRVAVEEANAFCTGNLRKRITEDTRVMWETGHLSKRTSATQVLRLPIQQGSVTITLPRRSQSIGDYGYSLNCLIIQNFFTSQESVFTFAPWWTTLVLKLLSKSPISMFQIIPKNHVGFLWKGFLPCLYCLLSPLHKCIKCYRKTKKKINLKDGLRSSIHFCLFEPSCN